MLLPLHFQSLAMLSTSHPPPSCVKFRFPCHDLVTSHTNVLYTLYIPSLLSLHCYPFIAIPSKCLLIVFMSLGSTINTMSFTETPAVIVHGAIYTDKQEMVPATQTKRGFSDGTSYMINSEYQC